MLAIQSNQLDSYSVCKLQSIDYTEVGTVQRIRAVQVISELRPGNKTKIMLAEVYGVTLGAINAWIAVCSFVADQLPQTGN